MAQMEHEIVLNAPPERVWAFITALRYLPLWLADVRAVEPLPGGFNPPETRPGSTFALERAGRRERESWIVADWEPPRRLRLTEYRRDLQLVFQLSASAEGTLLRAALGEPDRRGWLGRIWPDRRREQMERSLAQLRELIALNRDLRLLHGVGDE